MKKKIKNFVAKHKKKIILVSCVGLCVFAWSLRSPANNNNSEQGKYVTLSQVSKGVVSKGVTAKGKLIPEKKIDLNVYKQEARLLKKHVSSGDKVRKGAPLFTFDKKDLVDQSRSAQLALREAQLSLESVLTKSQQTNYSQEESDLRLKKITNQINDIDPQKKKAHEKFYATDLEWRFENESDRDEMQQYRPQVSGTYEGQQGVYSIRVYSSSARSGYSYEISGLEEGLFPVNTEKKERFGTKGLYITFPQRVARGTWVLKIPNVDAENYDDNKKEYEDKLRELDEQKITLQLEYRKEQQAQKEKQLTDNSDRRQLTVEQARLRVEQAQQALIKARQSVADRTIRAPFSGIVHNMRNLVEGTKMRSDDNTVQFGTLLTEAFVIQFSLGIKDVTAVNVGDTIHFTIPAMSSLGSLPAKVQEVSVVPGNDGRYEVLARVEASKEMSTKLRSGLNVSIEASRERKEDVLRVPNGAVHYDGTRPYVEVMPQVASTLQNELKETGSIRADNVQILSEKRYVTVGLRGSYNTEIKTGLQSGEYIVTLVSGKSAGPSLPMQDYGSAGSEYGSHPDPGYSY